MTMFQGHARNAGLALCLLIAAPALAQAPGPSQGDGLSTARSVDARFHLAQAIETAEREGKGRAMEAIFSPFPTGGGALEVTLMRGDASVTKYRIDANTGEIVNVTEQTIASYTTSLNPEALGHAKMTMTQAITAAEAFAKGGDAIGAEVRKDGDALNVEVNVLKDGVQTSFTVGPDGKVLGG